MLTLDQILKASNHSIFNKRSKYRLEALRSQNGNDNHGDYIQFLAQIVGGSQPRKSMITFYNGLIVMSPVIVYCSCDYFKYNLEIALVARGSARQLHADGLYPTRKNPNFKPGLCVHLAILAQIALNSDKIQKKSNKIKPKISKKLVKN